jgi:hypothetical protein
MTTKALLLTSVALAGPLLLAHGQNVQTPAATPGSAPALSPTEQTIKDIKNPAPWFSWGTDLRIRDESFDNILTLNPNNHLHQQDYLRFRGRLWASVTPIEDLSVNARLTDEVREWLKPAGYTPYSPNSGLDWREGLIDNLNVQWKNVLDQPLNVTVGRQDYLPGTPSGLGDGWLIGDGTPADGSWTYFLDSARLTYALKEQHTTIDAIGIIQEAKDDAWLPTINPQHYYLTEQSEKGAILWVANKSVAEANVDTYFIYKHDDASDITPVAKFRPDSGDIYTVGGRVSGLFANNWKYSLEGAYQFGEKLDPNLNSGGNNLVLSPAAQTTGYRNIDAFGVNARIAYMFKDKLNNQLSFSYEFLSGDDPNSKNDEMFDNLWGRWPRWSEIGLYSYAAETRIGNEANLHRLGPGWSFTPVKDMDLSFAYMALFAQHDIATRATGGAGTLFAGNANLPDQGNFRGHFFQAILKYKFSKHVSAHLWTEFQLPGSYYTYDNTWYFIRPEVTFTF